MITQSRRRILLERFAAGKAQPSMLPSLRTDDFELLRHIYRAQWRRGQDRGWLWRIGYYAWCFCLCLTLLSMAVRAWALGAEALLHYLH